MQMKNKISSIICTLLILSVISALFPFGAYAFEKDDIVSLEKSTLAFKVKEGGAANVQRYIDGYLTDHAGSASEWMIMALTRTDRGYDFCSYAKALDNYVKNNNVASASTRQMYSLLFIFCGDGNNPFIERTMNDSIGELGIMSYVYALHLFNNGRTSEKFTSGQVVDKLLSLQLGDGGWAVSGQYGDPDVTAMTLQALAYHYDTDQRVRSACDNALSFLSGRQNDDGCYSSYGVRNAESTAQVIIACASLGADPLTDGRFIKNGKTLIDGLMLFRMSNGSYCHKEGGEYSSMATIQALSAYIALERLETGRSMFYVNRPIVPGDLSGDGEVDSADAVIALKADAGLIELDGEQTFAGDVNNDGEVSSLDAVLILKLDAGLIDSF